MADKSDDELKKEVAIEVLRFCGGFGLAWFAWQIFSMPDGFFFGFLAVICAVAGLKRGVIAIIAAIKLTLRKGKRARFKAKGVDPKADDMAKETDLKEQGLLK